MEFTLHPNLQTKSFVIDLPLCRVLLEDNHNYPWLFLVPRKNGLSRMIDLMPKEQMVLMQELDFVQRVMWEECKPSQLNVAAIGNKTEQLHIHVIARYKEDPAWPLTVWDHPLHLSCTESVKRERIERFSYLLKIKESNINVL